MKIFYLLSLVNEMIFGIYLIQGIITNAF